MRPGHFVIRMDLHGCKFRCFVTMDLKRSVALVDSKPMVIKADPSMAYVGKLSRQLRILLV